MFDPLPTNVDRGKYYLTRARTIMWAFFWIFVVLLIIFRFYSPSAHTFTHTYQTSVPPGTLSSQRWKWDFWAESLYVLAWLVPATLAFMIDARLSRWRRVFHLLVLILLFIWFVVQMAWGIADWANANKTDMSNYDNHFNDERWCCIYYNLPGAPCTNTAACSPAVGAGDLKPNGVALYRFWFNIVLIVMVVVDFALTLTVWINAARILTRLPEGTDPSMEQQLLPMANNAQHQGYSGRAKRDRGRR